MAERSADRTPSVSSSVTEADSYDEKNNDMKRVDSFTKLRSPDELEIGDDVERAGLLPQQAEQEKPQAADPSMKSAVVWMVVNTLATIGIVSFVCFLL